MSYELVINSQPNEMLIALLKEKRLIELHREKKNIAFSVGDIYLGRVKKVMQGLNAAFVDVGHEKDAFLHYLDLGPQVLSLNKYVKDVRNGKQNTSSLMYFKNEEDIRKDGKISDVLQSGQDIIIQIAKEPISTKGPRISSEISIAGRYIVLVPFSERVSVSQKIKNSEEKERLKKLMLNIKPKNFGVIVRTVAEGKSVADLENDLKDLMKKWDDLFKELKNANPPYKALGELDRASAFLRDMLNPSYSSITVNEQEVYDEIRSYLQNIAPDKENILKLYKSNLSIFEHFGLEKQIKSLFGKTVTMKSGAYLIIEKTEALHVIDVNSGNRSKSDMSQESNALEVNLDAAVEIARQLRLRDMGGIIVVDFIDMHDPENRKILYQRLKEEMAEDKAKHTILPPSKFGLVQITRERVRPEVEVKTTEKCPSCGGTGEVQASILLTDEIENQPTLYYNRTKRKKSEHTCTSVYCRIPYSRIPILAF
ncbi:MAG: ribonuclease G [Bacteroidia bacterium]|nr:MAG: ribonuclease G [Bacteroidia bacterium]